MILRCDNCMMILEGNGLCPKCNTLAPYQRELPYTGQLPCTIKLICILAYGLRNGMPKPPRQELILTALDELIPNMDAMVRNAHERRKHRTLDQNDSRYYAYEGRKATSC